MTLLQIAVLTVYLIGVMLVMIGAIQTWSQCFAPKPLRGGFGPMFKNGPKTLMIGTSVIIVVLIAVTYL